MLTAILSGLLQMLVVAPLAAEVQKTLGNAGAPSAMISQVEACVNNGVPELVKQVGDNPARGVSLALDVWLGRSKTEDAILMVAPSCAAAVEAARPYLRQGEA